MPAILVRVTQTLSSARRGAFALRFVATLLAFALFPLASQALNSGITYHGRILEPDGVTPIAGVTVFKMQIRTPDSSNCVMYEEWQTIDLTGTNGVFAITINDGTGTREDSSGYTLDTIFANRGTFTFNPSTCTGSASYTPGIGDGRNLKVSFKTATMTTDEDMPLQSLNFAPLAIEAKQVSGFQAANLLRFQNSDGTLVNTSPLNNAQYTELVALIGGSSSQYQKPATSSTGTSIFATPGGIGSTTVGSMWLDTTGGSDKLKIVTDGGVQTVGLSASGNFVTSVATGTGLTGGPITGTGTISIAPGGVTSTELADNSVTSAKIVDGAITGADLNAGIVIATTGTVSAAGVGTRSLGLSNAQTPVDTISFSVPTNTFTSYNLVLPAAAPVTGQALVVSDSSSGQLAWGNATGLWTQLAGGSYYNGTGGVGIGTTAPTQALSVAGNINTVSGSVTADGVVQSQYLSTTVYSSPLSTWGPASGGILKSVNGTSADGVSSSVQLQVANSNGNKQSAWIAAVSNSGSGSYTPAIVIGQQNTATGSIERLRIDASGNVGIGTTSPAYKLDVSGPVNATALKVNGVDVATSGGAGGGQNSTSALTFNSNSDGTGTDGGFNFQSNGTNLLTIANNGDTVFTSTTTSNSTTTGAVKVAGGLGVAGSVNANIFAAASGSAAAPSHTFTSDLASGVWSPASGSVAVSTAGAERLRVTSAGNVGIGTTSPAAVLDVVGTPRFTKGLSIGGLAGSWGSTLRYLQVGNGSVSEYTGDPTGVALSANATDNGIGHQQYITNGAASDLYTTGGTFLFEQAASGTAGGTINWSYPMAINASGNVGIGTTTPGSKLQVAGQVDATAYSINGVPFSTGGANAWTQSGSAVFPTTATVVGIGTSTPAGVGLDIEGGAGPLLSLNIADTAGTALSAKGTVIVDAGSPAVTALNVYGRVSQTAPLLEVGATSASPGSYLNVSGSGNVGIGTTAPASTLDVSGPSNFAGNLTVTNASIGLNSNFLVRWGGSGNFISGSNATNSIWMTTNSAQRLTIDSSGDVGIGTTAPAVSLEVSSSTIFGFPASSGSTQTGGIARFSYPTAVSNLVLDIGGNSAAGNWIQSSNRLSLNNTYPLMLNPNGGNVGIGTTAPADTLDVNGAINAGQGLLVDGATALSVDSVTSPTRLQVNNTGGNRNLYLYTGSTASSPAMVLQNGTMNVGVNTTSPALKFDVNGSAIFRGPTVGGIDGELYYDSSTHTYRYYNASASAWQALGTGNITYSGTLWNQNGSNLYYNSGSVGVGTNAPGSTLSVSGSSSFGSFAGTAAPTNSLIVGGNIGAGEANPTSPLVVKGNFILEGTSSGSVGFRASSSGSNGVVWTLPLADGTSGQILKTNGSAVLSWTTPVAGTVTSVTGTAPISVATGTVTPVISLAAGTAAGQTLRWDGTSTWAATKLKYTDLINAASVSPWPASCSAGQALSYSTVTDGFTCVTVVGGTSAGIANGGNTLGAPITIGTTDTYSLGVLTSGSQRMTITSSGSVGIGTTAPSSLLQVNGATPSLKISDTSSSNVSTLSVTVGQTTMTSTAPTGASIIQLDPITSDGSSTPVVRMFRSTVSTNAPSLWINRGDGSNTVDAKIAGGNGISYLGGGGGNVGIGTTTPQAILDINGDIRLKKNTSAPVACASNYDGRIALTSQYTTCVCNGTSSAWVRTNDGTSACAW